MEAPKVCPSTLTAGYDTYSPVAKRKLLNNQTVSHILPYSGLNASIEENQQFNANRKSLSLSGAQSKFSMVIKNREFQLAAEGEQSTYILKPKLTDYAYPEFSPANEHLTMQIAEQVYGIETASNGLCFFNNGEAAYITKRYDVAKDGTKIQQEDFASLAGVTSDNAGKFFKYDAKSYEDIALLIQKYISAWRIEMIRYFDIILFNFLFSNGDAHLKNFSVLQTPNGDYRLAPAYDLINTQIHIPDDTIFALRKGLFNGKEKYQTCEAINGRTFLEFGKQIGISEKIVKRELDKFCANYEQIYTLIQNSFLSEPLKKIYRISYKTRLETYLKTGL